MSKSFSEIEKEHYEKLNRKRTEHEAKKEAEKRFNKELKEEERIRYKSPIERLQDFKKGSQPSLHRLNKKFNKGISLLHYKKRGYSKIPW